MTKRLGLGIIGIGRIAQAHIAAAQELSQHVKMVAFSSRGVERARSVANKAGVEKVYADYRELLADPEVDAVIICLPQDLHRDCCIRAAEAGKHILIEKPMALTTAASQAMVQAAADHDVQLMVAQSRRFPAAVQALVTHLPEIGELFRVHIQFLVSFTEPPTDWWRSADRAGGLVIMLQGSHSLDSVLWWFGDRSPTTVFATGSRRNTAWEGEDEADIMLSYDDGGVASVHLSLSTAPPVHEALLVGTAGNLRLVEKPTGKPFGFSYRLEMNGDVICEEETSDLYTAQLRAFADAVTTGREPPASGREILRLMHVLEAAQESLRKGVAVQLAAN